jgi:hypothetical protein
MSASKDLSRSWCHLIWYVLIALSTWHARDVEPILFTGNTGLEDPLGPLCLVVLECFWIWRGAGICWIMAVAACRCFGPSIGQSRTLALWFSCSHEDAALLYIPCLETCCGIAFPDRTRQRLRLTSNHSAEFSNFRTGARRWYHLERVMFVEDSMMLGSVAKECRASYQTAIDKIVLWKWCKGSWDGNGGVQDVEVNEWKLSQNISSHFRLLSCFDKNDYDHLPSTFEHNLIRVSTWRSFEKVFLSCEVSINKINSTHAASCMSCGDGPHLWCNGTCSGVCGSEV